MRPRCFHSETREEVAPSSTLEPLVFGNYIFIGARARGEVHGLLEKSEIQS